jgi:hypothetical protein
MEEIYEVLHEGSQMKYYGGAKGKILNFKTDRAAL